jgi:hypothetical protein
MFRKELRIIIGMCLVVCLFGCSQNQTQVSTTAIDANQGETRVSPTAAYPTHPLRVLKISEDICNPPCWMGIVPFETTYEEALEIVESLVFFSSAGYIRINEDQDLIVWHPGGGNEVYINFRGNYVYYIDFDFRRSKLEYIVQSYGVPEFYTIVEGDSEYGIDLYYPQIGIVFSGYGLNFLSEKTIISGACFVSPGTPENFYADYIDLCMTQSQRLRYSEPELFPWEGYGVCPHGLTSDYLCEE